MKRRIVAAGQRAGLTIQASRMRLRREHRDRLIQVDMLAPTGPYQRCVISVSATVDVNGCWLGRVKIACAAADDAAGLNDWRVPNMRGREAVLLQELAQQLADTIKEREQVAVARKEGIKGPYTFDRITWETP